MEREIRNNQLNDRDDERLEGFAAAEMADRGPKDVLANRPTDEVSMRPVNGTYNPGDDEDLDDEDTEDDLVLGDEDDLDDEDFDEDDIEVEVDDDFDADDVDDDDLVLDANDDVDEEDEEDTI